MGKIFPSAVSGICQMKGGETIGEWLFTRGERTISVHRIFGPTGISQFSLSDMEQVCLCGVWFFLFFFVVKDNRGFQESESLLLSPSFCDAHPLLCCYGDSGSLVLWFTSPINLGNMIVTYILVLYFEGCWIFVLHMKIKERFSWRVLSDSPKSI